MRFALDRYGSRGHFLFEKHSFIDFQIGKERKREFRAAEMRFYLHKEFCAAEIRFYLYKEFSRGTMWQLFDSECSSRSFPLWKEVGAILKKMAISFQENALRDFWWFFMILYDFWWFCYGGGLEENGNFLLWKTRCALLMFLSRHSQFENRSLVDFEIGNERKSNKFAYIW